MTFYKSIAVIGTVAAVAVFALTQAPTLAGMNLHTATDSAFNKYLAKYGKSYATKEEYAYRKSIFDRTASEMASHNSRNDVTWSVALNQFSDMTDAEIKRTLGGGIEGESRPHLDSHHQHHLEAAPTAGPIDWRNQMNPVKDQGACGSCWAFAAIGSLEGRYAIRYGKKQLLSEQQLVDCAKTSQGCNGGWSSKALQYLQQAGGSMSSASYPYTARNGACRFNAGQVVAKVSGVNGVADPQAALASGPIAIYVQAQGGFMSYGGGIYNGYCGQYDHAVTLVGYGTSGSVGYWIIRNSWGAGWGESGHIRIQANGNCKLTWDSYPVVQ